MFYLVTMDSMTFWRTLPLFNESLRTQIIIYSPRWSRWYNKKSCRWHVYLFQDNHLSMKHNRLKCHINRWSACTSTHGISWTDRRDNYFETNSFKTKEIKVNIIYYICQLVLSVISTICYYILSVIWMLMALNIHR